MPDPSILATLARAYRKAARARRSAEQAATEVRTLMLQARAEGHTYSAIAERLGISRARAEQIVKRRRE